MDVRLTFGTRKGQICDVEPSTALAMLADGRAERPCPEVSATPASSLKPEVLTRRTRKGHPIE